MSSDCGLRLPYELLLLILDFSPPSSLATLCRVSSDFLLVAGPKLYRDVSITSIGALGKLFCESRFPSPRLTPSLSLSLIKSLTLTLSYSPHEPSPTLHASRLSSSRLGPSSSVLPLDSLHLSITNQTSLVYSFLHRNLLPLVSPLHLTLRALTQGNVTLIGGGNDLLPSLSSFNWSRLKTLRTEGGIVLVAVDAMNGLYSFAGLPLPRIDKRREISIDLTPSYYHCSFGPWVGTRSREMMISRMQGWVLGDMFLMPGTVRLVVPTEEAKDKLEFFLGTESRFGSRKVFVVSVKEGASLF